MAYLMFSGGHALQVAGDASTAEDTLTGDDRTISNRWTHLQSGDSIVRVNPATVSYIVNDEDFATTVGPR